MSARGELKKRDMIPIEEIKRRILSLQQKMNALNIDGALILQRADLYYFSGTAQNAQLFIPADGEPLLVVRKSLARARAESPLSGVIPFTGWEDFAGLIETKLSGSISIGMETDVIPAQLYFRYQKLFQEINLKDISQAVREIRAVKSEYELEKMAASAQISERVFDYARTIIKAGMTEVELAAMLEARARTLGHQGAVRMRGFNQELYYGHIMSGENAAAISFFDGPTGGTGLNPSFPQGAGMKIINPNEPVLIDFVTVNNGYMVDQTRIFSVGEIKGHLMAAYRSAVEIKRCLMELGKPGCTGSELYKKANDMAARAGLANHFMGYTEKVNFVGHGVGIELDEMPVIARGLDIVLDENMVFALEPKFIFPGEGTVGIEDTFVVKKNGLEQLTTFSDDLQIL